MVSVVTLTMAPNCSSRASVLTRIDYVMIGLLCPLANPRLYTTGICREHLLPSSCSKAPATSAVQHLEFLAKIVTFAIVPFPSILGC
jgi:hypothetical protein